jgi:pimeloyl-ACP methyl ester carboxylesterase
MTNFVLVHGAWSGAHTFRRLRPLLRRAGHEVFTPSLTGIGERVHLASPQVNLATHVRDVVNLILYEDLTQFVLLGFSYGGFVVTGALDHVGERVRHLVYLDAFVPNDGDSVRSLTGSATAIPISLGEPWQMAPPAREYDDPAETVFASARRTPHPIACFTEPVRLRRRLEDCEFTRTYIKATTDEPDAPGAKALWSAAARAKASPAWNYREIATSHMVASNRPEELAEMLLELG